MQEQLSLSKDASRASYTLKIKILKGFHSDRYAYKLLK